MVTKFLEDLITRIERVNLLEVGIPDNKIEKGQQVVGSIRENEPLKRLYAVRQKIIDQIKSIKKEISHIAIECSLEGEFSSKTKELQSRLKKLNAEFDTVNGIFWTSIRYEFPEIASKNVIGIARNWQVYWSELDEDALPADVIIAEIFRRYH